MLPDVEQLSSLENLIVFQCPQLQWGAGVVEQLRRDWEKALLKKAGEKSPVMKAPVKKVPAKKAGVV